MPSSVRSPPLAFASTSQQGFFASGPPSPTASVPSTSASAFNDRPGAPRIVVTRADLKQSITAYETLLSSAKAYRNALLALATATSGFAVALEDCARQKGAAGIDEQPGHSASERLMAAAGLHHLAGNHTQILADSLYKRFEIPLLEEFDEHRNAVAERQAAYEKQVQAKTKAIRDTEAANMKQGRKKNRDLSHFRRALNQLQSQVDDLDRLKFSYYSELLDGQQETWELIADKAAIVVRSEHELYDRVASKATADTVLDTMVQSVPDPFNEFDRPEDGLNGGNRIFSILPPMSSIINTPSSSLARTPNQTPSPKPDDATRSRSSTMSASDYDSASPETPKRPSRAERDLSVVEEGDDASTVGELHEERTPVAQDRQLAT